MKSFLGILLAAVFTLSFYSTNAMTLPSTASFAKKELKKLIDSQINYTDATAEYNAEGTVNVSVAVNDNEMRVTFIDGNAELSEYVQANLEHVKVDNPRISGTTFDFELNFSK